jgi:3-oxoacyl-[acyl-carrier-protein] synthase III
VPRVSKSAALARASWPHSGWDVPSFRAGVALILAVEAPSRYLRIRPGAAGEAAALFGDGVAAALLASDPVGPDSVPVQDVTLSSHGEAVDLIRAEPNSAGGVDLSMDGGALASRAVRAMAQEVRELTRDRRLQVRDLDGVVVQGGNGRMPALVARQLGMPVEYVWSCTAEMRNLGAASLPASWAALPSPPRGPVVWTAAGAGLISGAALTGTLRKK